MQTTFSTRIQTLRNSPAEGLIFSKGGFKTFDQVREQSAGRRKKAQTASGGWAILRRPATPPSGLRRGFSLLTLYHPYAVDRPMINLGVLGCYLGPIYGWGLFRSLAHSLKFYRKSGTGGIASVNLITAYF